MIPECWNSSCHEHATMSGDGAFICAHEHMVRESDYCRRHWTAHRETAVRGSLNCAGCYYAPGEFSHWCVLSVVSPEPPR